MWIEQFCLSVITWNPPGSPKAGVIFEGVNTLNHKLVTEICKLFQKKRSQDFLSAHYPLCLTLKC